MSAHGSLKTKSRLSEQAWFDQTAISAP